MGSVVRSRVASPAHPASSEGVYGSLTIAATAGTSRPPPTTRVLRAAQFLLCDIHSHILSPLLRHPRPSPCQLEAGDKLKPILLVVGGGTALSIPFYFVSLSHRTRSLMRPYVLCAKGMCQRYVPEEGVPDELHNP